MTEEEALDLAAMLDLDDDPATEASADTQASPDDPAAAPLIQAESADVAATEISDELPAEEALDTLDGLFAGVVDASAADTPEATNTAEAVDAAEAADIGLADWPETAATDVSLQSSERDETADSASFSEPAELAPLVAPPATVDTDSLLGSAEPSAAPGAVQEAATPAEVTSALDVPESALADSADEENPPDEVQRRAWPSWVLPLVGAVLGSLLAGALAYAYFAQQLSAQNSALEAQGDKLQQLEKDNRFLQRAAEGGQEELEKLQQALEAAQLSPSRTNASEAAQVDQATAETAAETAAASSAKPLQMETIIPAGGSTIEAEKSGSSAAAHVNSAVITTPAAPAATTQEAASAHSLGNAAENAALAVQAGPPAATAPEPKAAPLPAPRVRLQRGGPDQPRSGVCDVDAKDPHKSLVECIKEFNR